MKKVLFLIVFSGFLAGCSKPAEQVQINKDTDDKLYNEYVEKKKEIEAHCGIVREYAQSVMRKRQYKNFTLEKDIASLYLKETISENLKNIIRQAYQYPKESSKDLKESSIHAFGGKIYTDCYGDEVHKVTN